MPFNRPTLSELRQRNQSYIQSELKTGGNLLRFSNIGVISDADAGMAHLHYGYLDYIARQSTPYNATDEYLAAWAALKDVFRKGATPASSTDVSFSGIAGRIIPAGQRLNRADGYQYQLENEVKIAADGNALGEIIAILPSSLDDATGGGRRGNSDAGTELTLDIAIDGVQATATALNKISGGADIESEDAFRSRMLLAYQNIPQGGNDADYQSWALTVPGVTRCWVKRRLMGAGTVGIYIMCDDNDYGGFPQGTDGISSLEQWGEVKATGDQGRVADGIYSQQPIIALVYVRRLLNRLILLLVAFRMLTVSPPLPLMRLLMRSFSPKGNQGAKFCGHLCCWQLVKSRVRGVLLCNLRLPILSCKLENSPSGVQ